MGKWDTLERSDTCLAGHGGSEVKLLVIQVLENILAELSEVRQEPVQQSSTGSLVIGVTCATGEGVDGRLHRRHQLLVLFVLLCDAEGLSFMQPDRVDSD